MNIVSVILDDTHISIMPSLPSVYIFKSIFSFSHSVSWNLQAPVSDREYRATLPETASMIDLASSLIREGRGSELMPRGADECSPMTANR